MTNQVWGWGLVLLWSITAPIYGQQLRQDSPIVTRGIVVKGAVEKESLRCIIAEPVSSLQLFQEGAFNLSDGLSKLPGMSQLSTGPGISKPVIRGLYGNRIMVLLSGLRFDNQQWQDEHGLGLANFGISGVEIIKGPLSVLYGSEATGGIIQVMHEAYAPPGKQESEYLLQLHSNTLGSNLQTAWKKSGKHSGFRIRIGAEHHADYQDGNGTRVLNSRFNGWYLKAGYQWRSRHWQQEWDYMSALNRFGFIFNDLNTFFSPDKRWSMSMQGLHHITLLNILQHNARKTMKTGTLSINSGIQSNYRAEDEGGGQLSLRMHLLSAQYAIRREHALLKRGWEWQWSQQGLLQTNTNYGGRRLIPDARSLELNAGICLLRSRKYWQLELGAGAGVRYTKALLTPMVNTPDKDIAPFQRTDPFGSGLAGIRWQPFEAWTFRYHAASGIRAPNLSELSSNGLHEGIYVYELGKPQLHLEKNLMQEINWEFRRKRFNINQSLFVNRFWDYIYLQPGTKTWFGFPVQEFTQQHALIYGSEIQSNWTPLWVQELSFEITASGLIGQLDNKHFLPYMPSWKLKPGLRYEYSVGKFSLEGWINLELVASQQRLFPDEKGASDYQLLNAGVQMHYMQLQFGLNASNLLNEAYYDHLSRLKYFNTLNMGRNISIYLKIKLLK